MSGHRPQAWVTQALHEQDVEKALVLGKSLRRVLTTKSLVVIVNPSISNVLRDALETTFDSVISLDEGKCRDLKWLSPDSLAKAFTLSLTLFESCIFLNPASLVLKNCDELFDDICTGSEGLNSGMGKIRNEVMYLKPSREAYKKLTDSLVHSSKEISNEKNDYDWDATFEDWMKNQKMDSILCLDTPYSISIGLEEKGFFTNDDQLVIVHLKDLPVKLEKIDPEKNGFFKKAGLLETLIYSYWLELYKNEVKPHVNSSCSEENLTTPQSVEQSRSISREPIAVIGMSCRHPGSNNISEFWDLLIEGRDAIRSPPEHRWSKEQTLVNIPEFRNTQAGFLSVPVDEFDAKFFGISPKEVIFMDPQHRLLHELVWEGLEDAGINPMDLKGTSGGVFLGSWRNDYQDILQRSATNEFYRGYMGNSIGAGASRISHLLGLTGPCIATESGCSAAMVAVHMACRSLQNGESNMALACGVNLLLHPFKNDIMPMVTAADGHCKTFDANADGFGRAEGCAVLILKKLSDAVRDEDRIWGMIRGSSIAQEGISKSMGTPTVACEAQAMSNALKDAKVHPSEVSYVETHGTGTIVGDPMEVAAIHRVYGTKDRQEPLVIGSVKTNVGHTESCSGITGIMKVLLSMRHEIIPAHRNFKELNPEIDLESIPAILPLEAVKWPKIPGKARMAGVSSFGITGTDGHVIIQEPLDNSHYFRQRIVLPQFERPLHILKITARSEEALDILLDRYKDSLSTGNSETFADIAFTANTGRATFPYRAAIIASDAKSASDMLGSGKFLKNDVTGENATGTSGNICFLFTGQGSQYHGMAKQLYDTSPVFRMHFDHCEEFLWRMYKISIVETFWGQTETKEAHRTLYSQLGIFVIEYCLMELWQCWGIKPNVVVGHSLGEFCAAVCCGILTLKDALTLVAERSRLIDQLPEGKMLVVKADKSTVDNLQRKFLAGRNSENWLDYAAINSNEQTVLAGDSRTIADFAKFLEQHDKGVKCSILQSTHAFHSRHMDPMLQEYREIAEKIKYNEPNNSCTFISGMLGKIVDGSSLQVNADYWVQHTRDKVHFLNASKVAYSEGSCRIFLEVGPHPVLLALTMLNNEGKNMACLPSLRRGESDWSTMLTSVGKLLVNQGIEVDWRRFDQFYERKKVGHALPTYPFQGTKYWPSITSQFGAQIHPLLGSVISNPTDSKLFQCQLNVEQVEYLKDHKISDTIVFPGAGFIEMLLMAGHASLDGVTSDFRLPRRPMLLQNFRIEAPLGLEEGGMGCVCQTVVEQFVQEDWNGFKINIHHEFRMDDDTSKWISHATGVFLPYNGDPSQNDNNLMMNQHDPTDQLAKIQTIMSTYEEESIAKEFYDKVEDVGLKFGPAFRTLQKVWRSDEQECLAEVTIPKDASSYLIHPTLIDAMIQMAVFHGGSLQGKKFEKKLQVPIGCEKFIWFRPLKMEPSSTPPSLESSSENEAKRSEDNQAVLPTDICYIYSDCGSKTVILLDSKGNLVAALLCLEAIETKAKTIKAMLETQVKSVPNFYTVEWRPTLGPFQNRGVLTVVGDSYDKISDASSGIFEYSKEELRMRESRDVLAFCHITNAFLSLGWKPKLGDRVNSEELVKQLGILPQHKKLIRQFLIFLEEDGLLDGVPVTTGDKSWTVKKMPPTSNQLISKANVIIQEYCSGGESTEKLEQIQFLLLQNVGRNLDKILTGNESALKIVFPEDESQPSVATFYDCLSSKSTKSVYGNLWKLWKEVQTAYQEKSLPLPTLRLVEVGAGTGSMTEVVLQSLEDNDIPYEYVYTDISAAFFASAEKRFDKYKRNMKFRKLNIEQDPTSQGFPPKYFNFVIASHVIHATRDVRESFLNMRKLMRDNGMLWLSELHEMSRFYDCIFGILEGYWRFTDTDLRPHHPIPSIDKWVEVGNDLGFANVIYKLEYQMALITYRAKDGGEAGNRFNDLSQKLNPDTRKLWLDNQVNWLIFYDAAEQGFARMLKERFVRLGRKRVILVNHSTPTAQNLCDTNRLSEDEYQINPYHKEDMDKVFSLFFKPRLEDNQENIGPIEGIVITWGMIGTLRDQSRLAKPYLHLLQNVVKLPKKLMPQLVLLTSGQHPVGDVYCESPSSSTLIGITRTVMNEHSEARLKGIDVNPTELESSLDEVFQEIFTSFNDEISFFTAYRGNVRFIPKAIPDKFQYRKLALPSSTNRFQLILPKSRSIQDLEFGDLEPFSLSPNEIEVKVKTTALNFKDIFVVLKPTEQFEKDDQVGLDISGVVTRLGAEVTKWEIGDAVFGFNINKNTLPSHIHLPEDSVAALPSSYTFTEAACFPAVFATAHYCLVKVAKVREGETLLIHAASGGVGLMAIQLAKHYRLQIIATAGSNRKRAYLRSLGIQHVFHSRNTNYGKEILSVTNGRGVDIVLNSLTGPGFKEATLDACSNGARFVEMSKLNTWTVEEVASLRPDVKYTEVDLTTLDKETSKELLNEQSKFVNENLVKPIPYTRFDAVDIRDALTYLQKAQHIGKVVVAMPEPKSVKTGLRMEQFTPLFNDRSTYLITGGLGGIGIEVCKYMLEQGGTHIVLVGRKPPTEKVTQILENLRKDRECNIQVIQADVGEWADCQRIFKELESLPPLRGIMHAAGALADGLIENLTWESFQQTYRSKVIGSWNLHDMTKDLVLEHFVLFSSVSASMGSPGQASHVSACAFEDGLAHFRNSHGLPATTINWGQFGQVGIAAEAEVAYIRPFSSQQGINALDVILRSNRNHMIVASFEECLDSRIKFLPFAKRLIDEQVMKLKDNLAKKGLQLSSTQFWNDYNDCKDDRDGKVDVVKKYIKIVLRHVLRLDQEEPIDENMELQDMGVDSLMMLEMKNHLQDIVGERVTITQSAVKDCTTVNLLGNRLVEIIEEEGHFHAVAPPTFDEIREMILKDSVLPEHIQVEAPGSEKRPSQIRRILLTGATGTLGSHMLMEVLKSFPKLDKIYCLIRTRTGQSSPEERLRSVLEKNCILSLIKNYDKVECVEGNLVEPQLGVSQDEYDTLSEDVDAIVHCGAKVSHTEYYRVVPGGRNDARSVNVGGLLNILQFACKTRTKHVLNASILLTINDVDEDGCLLESWPEIEKLQVYTNSGYVVSKHVCDLLLKEASEGKGLPCKTLKYTELRGSIATGRSLAEQSHHMKSFLFFMKEGIMPDTPAPLNIVPMDIATKLTVLIMSNDDAPNGPYNVCHPRPQLFQECFPPIARELGHPVQLVETNEYRKRCLESFQHAEEKAKEDDDGGVRGKAILAEFQTLYQDEASYSATNSAGWTRSMQKFFENAEDFFVSKKLVKLEPHLYWGMGSSHEIIKRDLIAAKKEGIFEKLGL